MSDETRTAVAPANDSTRVAAGPTPPSVGTGDASFPGSDDGRYVLSELIARGGMGEVYRATDRALGREVAVKTLQPRIGLGSAAARRFATEAAITACLQHPAIPAVHDHGTLADGRPYLAMKLVSGRTLDQLLKVQADSAADRGRFVAAVEKVCEAIGYAHSTGVVHRDLKPANVMIGAFGEVQVMDWGLAKAFDSRPAEPDGEPDPLAATTQYTPADDGDHTQPGSVLGTPPFMPPEQASGAVELVDRRSDVFGLGGLLCVVLTGLPPFVGGSAESTRLLAARGKVEDAYARLDGCGADPELVALAKRCLAPEQADRPADGGEVAAAVAAYRVGVEERLRRSEVERAEAAVRAAERWKRQLLYFVLAVVAGLGTVAVVDAGRQKNQRATEELARQLAEREAARAAVREAAVEAETLRAAARREKEPRRWLAGARSAATATARAEAALARAISEELNERVTALRKAVDADVRDATLFDRFEAAEQLVQLPTFHIPLGQSKAQEAYAVAFREYGWDLAVLDPAEFARRVETSPHRTRCVRALLRWTDLFPSGAADGLRPRLFNVQARVAPVLVGYTLKFLDGIRDGDRPAADAAAGLLGTCRDADAVPPAVRVSFAVEYASKFQTRDLPPGLLSPLHTAPADDFFAQVELGRLYQSIPLLQDLPRSVAHLRAARAIRPDSELANWLLLSAHSQQGRHDEAEADATGVIAALPEFAFAHLVRGRSRHVLGRWKAAEADIRRAADLAPREADPYLALAELYLDAGRLGEAVAAADRGLAMPESSTTHLQRMVDDLRAKTADRPEQVPETRRLVAEFSGQIPNLTELALVLKANALRLQGRDAEALAILEKSSADCPNSAVTAFWLSDHRFWSGDLTGALAAAKGYAKCPPPPPAVAMPYRPDVWENFVAAVARADADWPAFNRTGERAPADADEAYYVALACRLRGRPAAAIDFFHAALRDRKDEYHGGIGLELAKAAALAVAADPAALQAAVHASDAFLPLGLILADRSLKLVKGSSRTDKVATLKELIAMRTNPWLLAVRDPARRAKIAGLSPDERQRYEQFWVNLDAQIKLFETSVEP